MLEMIEKELLCRLTEKSEIYSLGVIFWELTSCKQLFDGLDDDHIIRFKILSGVREEPVPDTNVEFIGLYQSKYKIIIVKQLILWK